MNTLVTGAAGASGAALLRILARDPAQEVHTTDLAPLSRGNHRVCDLTDPAAVDGLIESVRPDAVFHLAGTFTNRFETDHPCNVLTSRNILESVRAIRPECRVLLVGSAAEYGPVKPNDNPVPEDRPLRPVSVYGLTKTLQTLLMGFYFQTHRTDVVMARTFNLDGPGISPNLLPGRLNREIERLRRRETDHIELGSLAGKRDFIGLDEAAGAYVRILEKGRAGEIYNVGSGKPILLRDYVTRRLAKEGLDPSVVREGAGEEGKTYDIWADIRKLDAL